MKNTWTIYHAYGAWVAEHMFGYTIWAMTKDELVELFEK